MLFIICVDTFYCHKLWVLRYSWDNRKVSKHPDFRYICCKFILFGKTKTLIILEYIQIGINERVTDIEVHLSIYIKKIKLVCPCFSLFTHTCTYHKI